MLGVGIEISEFKGIGYQAMIDFNQWRVAILRYIDELEVQNLNKMQRHDETDEVFVLLEGACTLFFAQPGEKIQEIEVIEMEPKKLYNVKQGVWHTHTLEQGTTVLIIENRNTNDVNSPTMDLSKEQMNQLQQCYFKRN